MRYLMIMAMLAFVGCCVGDDDDCAEPEAEAVEEAPEPAEGDDSAEADDDSSEEATDEAEPK